MDYIDLRSDTVTHPTPAMLEAMAKAKLGDDVYGEDPTVNALEAESAELFGKDAGLFVSSGTQGNLVSLLAHCQRGDEAIVGDAAHTFMYEAGGMAALGGIQPHTIPVQADGTFKLEDVRGAIRGDNYHFPTTRLIGLENTHGGRGAIPVSKAFMDSVADIAREHDLKTHVDGARIFNAAVALDTPVKALCERVDSVTFCLSKGLSAPVGSIVVGDADFIARARRARKMLGGGMRQAGMLAAAGRVAIHEMVDRLADDHANAQVLADGLMTVPGLTVERDKVHTNFVFFTLNDDAKLDPKTLMANLWNDYRIRISPYPGYARRFRCVTHYWITPERIDQTITALREQLSE
jgi:threonine aldolase